MTAPIEGVRGHVAPCNCERCINDRVAAISAGAVVILDDGPAPDLTEAQRRYLWEWAQRNILPRARWGSWHADSGGWLRITVAPPPRDPRGLALVTHRANRAERRRSSAR